MARLTAENSAKRPRLAPTSGSDGTDDMFPQSPAPQPFRLRSLYRDPSTPVEMEVSDQDDPQPLPQSPSVQDTGRGRFRSLVDDLPFESDSGSEYQPRESEMSNSDSAQEGLPDSAQGLPDPPAVPRSPSIPPPLGRRGGRSGRAPGRPSLQHRRRGRGRGALTVPAQGASAPVPAVPTLAPAAPAGPRRQRARQPIQNPSILYEKSYRRARGPQREAGDPIRQLLNPTIVASDKHTVWHSQRVDDSPDISEIHNPIPLGHPADHVKNLSPEDLFSAFLPDDVIVEHIINPTNRKISELRGNIGYNNIDRASYKNTYLKEIKALFGVLIMSGARHANTLSSSQIFHPLFGSTFYRCILSQRRFDFLIRCLRFDDHNTRQQRKADRFFLIRVLWELVVAKCKENWVAGPIVTVDEQLLGFRGRVLFRMFIANKPNRYGIKIFMSADAESHYCLDAIPYLGKGSTPELPQNVNQGHYFTLEVLKDLMEAGRTICLDNWFTSLNLTKELQNHGMHLVGTIKPKGYLPKKSDIAKLRLDKDESVAIFDHTNGINVVYKKVKPTKHVAIMTTVHNKFTYVEQTKTEAHMFYNASKGGVDTFDAMCASSDIGRKTVRWPMAVFYGLLNMIVNNAYIIYAHTAKTEGRRVEKMDFLQDMAYSLSKPLALERLEKYGRWLSDELKDKIKSNFVQGQQVAAAAAAAVDPEEPFTGWKKGDTKKRCKYDARSAHYSGKNLCHGNECRNQPICQHHSVLLCKDCYEKVKHHL